MSRTALARIQREYDELAVFAAGATVDGNAALVIATACLTAAPMSADQIEQLAVAGALIALEIDRLLTGCKEES